MNLLKDLHCRKCGKKATDVPFVKDTRRGSGFRDICKFCTAIRAVEERAIKGDKDVVQAVKEYAEKISRNLFLKENPHLKWCNQGLHFTEKENFGKQSQLPCGLRGVCKKCSNNQYQDNSEHHSRRKKEHYKNNAVAYQIRHKKWRDSNPLKYRQVSANYRQNNKDKVNTMQRDWYHANKDRALKQRRVWYQTNREKALQTGRRYYEKNKLRYKIYAVSRRLKLKNTKGSYSLEQWLDKLEFHGWQCYLCKRSLESITIHAEHRIPLSRGGLNFISNIAPACAKCNLSKHTKTEKEFIAFRANIN